MPEHEHRTRQGLDAALRKLLEQRPLDQLRVRELTELCGLRRQSFYYHFKDVYDLFAWSVRWEGALLLERQEECLTWQQALLDLLGRAQEERSFYRAVLDQGGQAALGAMIPLERTLETVQAYYRDRGGAPLRRGPAAVPAGELDPGRADPAAGGAGLRPGAGGGAKRRGNRVADPAGPGRLVRHCVTDTHRHLEFRGRGRVFPPSSFLTRRQTSRFDNCYNYVQI